MKTSTKKSVQSELKFDRSKPKFYTYRQNNSGGGFVQDHKQGISVFVCIEAESASQADDLAEQIGLYFNGCDTGADCSCCGDRWYHAYKDDGTNTPMMYDQDISKGEFKENFLVWMKDGIEGYIHYLNGKVKKVKGIKVPYVAKSK